MVGAPSHPVPRAAECAAAAAAAEQERNRAFVGCTVEAALLRQDDGTAVALTLGALPSASCALYLVASDHENDLRTKKAEQAEPDTGTTFKLVGSQLQPAEGRDAHTVIVSRAAVGKAKTAHGAPAPDPRDSA